MKYALFSPLTDKEIETQKELSNRFGPTYVAEGESVVLNYSKAHGPYK